MAIEQLKNLKLFFNSFNVSINVYQFYQCYQCVQLDPSKLCVIDSPFFMEFKKFKIELKKKFSFFFNLKSETSELWCTTRLPQSKLNSYFFIKMFWFF